ncbi:flagellar basal body-associated protein FliL [Paenibacillus shirakamiensis]|uniref:Flagellar basal body-associated protein FliL n=1 Tax=Paenibacillus shirakamiensis TaxID=1265935 RepID=A0ABS4JJC0_9BACL|nr:DNA-directed RNA polymerase subunit beta [Paenibacillus shirakamiensis]MBP2001802.1 flagellar basal body-associated protein FliL [Paenibacillus shirakamiensis]
MTEESVPVHPRRTGLRRSLLILCIIVALIVMLFIGMIIGYVVLGKGNFSDVFHFSTWRHVYDLIFAP